MLIIFINVISVLISVGSPKKQRRAISMPVTPQGAQLAEKEKEKGVDFEGDAVMVSARSQSDKRAHSANHNQRKSGNINLHLFIVP